jgi:hypothetical protein
MPFNPRHSVHRNQLYASATIRGIPPEMFLFDGALVAYLRIPPPSRPGCGSLKTPHTHAARKSRDTEHQAI